MEREASPGSVCMREVCQEERVNKKCIKGGKGRERERERE